MHSPAKPVELGVGIATLTVGSRMCTLLPLPHKDGSVFYLLQLSLEMDSLQRQHCQHSQEDPVGF